MGDDTDGTQPERLSDPKRAVVELAKALDEAIWLVSGDAVAFVVADVPSPAPEALASAVLRTEVLADPTCRKPLLMRLAPDAPDSTNVRRAARALLAGRAADVVGQDAELFHDRVGNGRALRILLRLLDRSWCAVQWELVQSLSQDVAEALCVGSADLEALHRLLDDCLHEPVDWTVLSDGEALHLLQRLYSAEPEDQRRWRTMPLHRDVDGVRGAFNDRARRSTGRTGELRLPPELGAEVRLLDPDFEVARLYDSVPDMDRDGFLQLMLEDSRPWRFAEHIVHSIRPLEGPALLPQDGELRDRITGSDGPIRAVVVAAQSSGDGTWTLVRDRELIQRLNPLADKPRSLVFAGAHPACDVTDLMADAQQYIESQIDALELPFALPAVESLACLAPGEAAPHGA